MTEDGKLNKEKGLELVKAITEDDDEKEEAAIKILDKCSAEEVPEDQ